MSGIVAFGDAWGLPMILGAAADAGCAIAACVIDTGRVGEEWRPGAYSGPVLPHPASVSALRAALDAPPSLGVTASYSRILSRELLDLFPLGVVNLHGGKLPEYRGANVLQWAIINGEKEMGFTLHYMVEAVDAGPVLERVVLPIDPNDTALAMRTKSEPVSRDLLGRWLPRLMRERLTGTLQDESRARAWPRRRPEDGEIDWDAMSDIQVRDLIRALAAPWPGAFYREGGEKVVLQAPLTLEEIRALRARLTGKALP